MSLAAAIAALQADVEAIKNTPPPPADTVDLTGVYASLDALTKLTQERVDVTPLADRLSKLAKRIKDIEEFIGIPEKG
jgi:predicted ATP-grasp superfamily ATP-dependent carboligase